VDAVLLTDNLFGQIHMSTLAGSALLVQNGVDAIMQLSCRNRNRIALLGDLFGAAALGVTSLLLVRGQKVPKEMKPRPKALLDVSATELIAIATAMKSDGRLESFPDFFLGGVLAPQNPKAGWLPKKLIESIDAGAQFVQMPICMDIDLLRRYMKHLVANKLVRRVSVMAATAIPQSADDARWLRENRALVQIPDAIVDRLDGADDPEREGIAICIEQLSALAEIPGISGATIMPGSNLADIPDIVKAAGLAS
jgi:methylenetetrahydrofolate reductase (NADPH)